MASRSLTAKFLQLRNDARQRSLGAGVMPGGMDGKSLLASGAASTSFEEARHTEQPFWCNVADQINEDIRGIAANSEWKRDV